LRDFECTFELQNINLSFFAEFLTSVETDKLNKGKKGGNIPEKTVTKTFEFAGQKLTVEEKVNQPIKSISKLSTSSKNKKLSDKSTEEQNGNDVEPGSSKTPKVVNRRISFLSGDPNEIGLGNGKKGGLAAVLNILKSKKHTTNLTTLEKSKLDWESFKKQHHLEEDLQNHTRSKDT